MADIKVEVGKVNVGVWLGIIVYLIFQLALVALAETCAQHYLEAGSEGATLSTLYLTELPAKKVVATSKSGQIPAFSQTSAF